MSQRKRYDGSQEDLAEVIRPFVTSTSWFQYQEKNDDVILPTILVAHKELIRSLTNLAPNLAFSSNMLAAVFAGIVKEKGFKELSDKDAENDFIETCCKRVHVACRHVSQSRLRKPPPKWLSFIDQMGDTPLETQTMPETSSLPTAESQEPDLEKTGDGDGHDAEAEGGADRAVPADAQQDDDSQVAATQVPST